MKLTNLVPSVPDTRDLLYIPLTGTVADETDLVTWQTPTENQEQQGACTAFGTSRACEMLSKRAGSVKDLSAQFLYYNTRAIEDRIGQEGAQTRNALRSAHHHGICYETTWPYSTANENVEPSPAAYAEAATMKALRYERIFYWQDADRSGSRLIRGLKSALQEGLGVVLAMRLGEQFRNIQGPLLEHNYINVGPGNAYIGNHLMHVRGVRDKTWPYGGIVDNSWGSGWGDNGSGLLSWPAITTDTFEAWAIRGFGDFEVKPPPGILLRELTRYYLSARIVPPAPQLANIWVGAKIGGVLKLKRPDETWVDYDGTFTQYRQNLMLDDEYDVVISDGYDLAQVPGAEVYLAYGADPLSWTLAKVCDVPGF